MAFWQRRKSTHTYRRQMLEAFKDVFVRAGMDLSRRHHTFQRSQWHVVGARKFEDLDILTRDCRVQDGSAQSCQAKMLNSRISDGELLRLMGAAKEQSVIEAPATPQNGFIRVAFSHA